MFLRHYEGNSARLQVSLSNLSFVGRGLDELAELVRVFNQRRIKSGSDSTVIGRLSKLFLGNHASESIDITSQKKWKKTSDNVMANLRSINTILTDLDLEPEEIRGGVLHHSADLSKIIDHLLTTYFSEDIESWIGLPELFRLRELILTILVGENNFWNTTPLRADTLELFNSLIKTDLVVEGDETKTNLKSIMEFLIVRLDKVYQLSKENFSGQTPFLNIVNRMFEEASDRRIFFNSRSVEIGFHRLFNSLKTVDELSVFFEIWPSKIGFSSDMVDSLVDSLPGALISLGFTTDEARRIAGSWLEVGSDSTKRASYIGSTVRFLNNMLENSIDPVAIHREYGIVHFARYSLSHLLELQRSPERSGAWGIVVTALSDKNGAFSPVNHDANNVATPAMLFNELSRLTRNFTLVPLEASSMNEFLRRSKAMVEKHGVKPDFLVLIAHGDEDGGIRWTTEQRLPLTWFVEQRERISVPSIWNRLFGDKIFVLVDYCHGSKLAQEISRLTTGFVVGFDRTYSLSSFGPRLEDGRVIFYPVANDSDDGRGKPHRITYQGSHQVDPPQV